MRNRNSLAIFMVIALTLSFASRVLAQTPIKGWDRAKFGMSPEELRSAYSEEIIEEDSQTDKYKSYRLFYLQPKFLKGFMGLVSLYFVDNELFEIELWFPEDSEEAIAITREERQFWLTLLEVESFLKQKYGTPVKEERMGERRISKWVDLEGNGLSLMVSFYPKKFEGYLDSNERDFTFHSFNPVYFFEVTYFHGKLTEKWEKKLTEIIMEDSFNREMLIENF